MLGKINSKSQLIALDEQIVVEYEGKDYTVDLKFSRQDAIQLSQISQEYIDNITLVSENKADITLQDADSAFLNKMLKFIDVSFIVDDAEKVNTILLIYEQLKNSFR